jgi:hypothetical protein
MADNYQFQGPVPNHVDLNHNIQQAVLHAQQHPSWVYRISWLIEQTRNNKDRHAPLDHSWDFKQIHPKYADFGNYHYGVVGTALGIPEEMQQKNQQSQGRSLG